MKDTYYLSIVIPCYNEASRGRGETSFKGRLNRLYRFMSKLKVSYEVILSVDGATDSTLDTAKNFVRVNNLRNWFVLSNEHYGKGYALQEGIKKAQGTFVLFMDADLSVGLDEIINAMYHCTKYNCVIGVRDISRSHATLGRKFVSRISRMMIRPLLPVKVVDTQCGFKLFPRAVFVKCLEAFKTKTWLFDVELLMIMGYAGIEIKEMRVDFSNETLSTVGKGAILSSLKELFSIAIRRRKIKRIVQKNWMGSR